MKNSKLVTPCSDRNSISLRASREIRQFIEKGFYPKSICKNPHGTAHSWLVAYNDVNLVPTGITEDERCILIVDIVKYSIREMPEQLILNTTLNALFKRTHSMLSKKAFPTEDKWEPWNIYKGSGDGATFIFGNLVNPRYIKNALMFAAYNMSEIVKFNQELHLGEIRPFEVRMALTYDGVFMTEDLVGNCDLVGDAINLANRLASIKEATGNSIFISNKIFHLLQQNRSIFFRNQIDDSPVCHGQLSDFVLGCKPDADNFLYIDRKGVFPTKDRKMEAYNVAGRINGIDIMPK